MWMSCVEPSLASFELFRAAVCNESSFTRTGGWFESQPKHFIGRLFDVRQGNFSCFFGVFFFLNS
jgi:hypothetical protein